MTSPSNLFAVALAESFLKDLPPTVVGALQRGAILHHIAAGQMIVDEAQPDWFGILLSGLARVYVDPPDSPPRAVRDVRPGAAVGIAALVGADHPVSVRAVSHCRVLQLDHHRVRAIVEREPSAARAALGEVVARLFDTYEGLATDTRASVRQRLAAWLLEAVDANPDVANQDNAVIVTHETLAAGIGSAREVVSRALEALARARIIELSRGHIRVLDRARLQSVATR